jgi:hypothetical protein
MNEILPAVTRQKLAIEGRSRRNDVTGKLREALHSMVWDAKDRKDAATAAGLKDRSVRDALKKPHVAAYLNAEMAARRLSSRAKNLDHLDQIAAESKNDVARVAAIKTMEIIDVAATTPGRQPGQQLPGLQIVIMTGPNSAPRVIGPEPAAIDHE